MRKKLKMTIQIILGLFIIAVLYGIGYLYLNPQFGGKISKEEKRAFAESSQWNGEKFRNLQETNMDMDLKKMPGLIKDNFTGKAERGPGKKLPILEFDQKSWDNHSGEAKFIWYGHSVGLFRMNNTNLLIDPMFGPDASPVGPMRTKRYSDSTLYIIDKLPEIDAVFISHDHYDHLDYESFQKLNGNVKHYYVPLGVKRHLLRWNIEESKITEMDWWDKVVVNEVEINFVPSRHFSGRGLFDRDKSLWGGFTLKSESQNIFWSGDSGYGDHFKEIGERLGPFDLAFVECGQYNENWDQIHMFPEESVQAALDVKAEKAMPIHWGAFTLALHDWEDPVERFKKTAQENSLPYMFPKMGEQIILK